MTVSSLAESCILIDHGYISVIIFLNFDLAY